MAGGNLSPRQKMIGMMYLVLTALLALNVSKDILNAFVLVNDGLEITIDNFGKKNDLTYAAFDFQSKNNPVKVKKYLDKANETKKLSAELIKYVDELKSEIISETDKLTRQQADTIHLEYVQSKDDNNVSGHILIGTTVDGAKGKARELKNKLIDYKKKLMALVSDVGGEKINLSIDTSDPKPTEGIKESWETHNFEHIPLAAVVTLLTKVQSDVKNAEADIINFLYSRIDAGDFKFDTLVAKVIAPSSYIIMGNEFTADVFVAAYSSTQDPEVLVNGSPIKVENGMGKYSVRPGKEGENKWGGVIRVKSPDGQVKEYPFEHTFTAAKPSTVVSPTKMNVLYMGVDNPVSISVPGIGADKTKAAISQGTLVPDPNNKGSFIARVNKVGEANIDVSAEIDKKVQPMGNFKFRVKMVPDPVAKVANKNTGGIQKSVLLVQSAIIPVLENFDFDLNFLVTSFTMSRTGKGRDPIDVKSESNAITSEMKDIIKNARLGDKIYFENIKAKGPDGTTRSLGSISFVLQ